MENVRSRDVEAALLDRCALVVSTVGLVALDQREANIFRLASLLVQNHFPVQAHSLMDAGERYFSQHQGEKLSAEDVVQRGWVIGLPRFRDHLVRRFADISHEQHAELPH